MASARRSSPPTGKPLKYQAMCLRRSAQPCGSSLQPDQQLGVPADHDRHLAEGRQRPGRARPAKASARSRNSHGRPRQPRPMTTPSTPVSATIRSASAASQMSPLPSTGMPTRAAFRAAIAVPVRLAGVGLLRRPPVQRDRRAAGLLGDPAGVQVGLMIMVDADPGLHGHRHAVRRRGPRPPRSRSARSRSRL